MARKPQKPAAPSKASLKPLLWAIMFAAVMFAVPGPVIVFLVGMLPTIVAFIVDKTPKKYAAFCVGGMNLSGVFPSLLDMWSGPSDMGTAMRVITDVFQLIVMYGAAAFGWMLYVSVPPVVIALMTIIAQHRIAELRATQRELIREWGPGIAAEASEGD